MLYTVPCYIVPCYARSWLWQTAADCQRSYSWTWGTLQTISFIIIWIQENNLYLSHRIMITTIFGMWDDNWILLMSNFLGKGWPRNASQENQFSTQSKLFSEIGSSSSSRHSFRCVILQGPTCQLNTLRPRRNGRRFADDTFKRIFLNENVRISIKVSLKFVPKGPINNNPSLVLIMAWRRPGAKPLSEPMLVRSLMHICVTRPQWVKILPGSVNNLPEFLPYIKEWSWSMGSWNITTSCGSNTTTNQS